ncbi:hypothetical protein FRC18_009335 [Serendipita sp. 400]|nr:hypothetical protein FRC18_009335 [Serendipita sp. 400]
MALFVESRFCFKLFLLSFSASVSCFSPTAPAGSSPKVATAKRSNSSLATTQTVENATQSSTSPTLKSEKPSRSIAKSTERRRTSTCSKPPETCVECASCLRWGSFRSGVVMG